MDKFTKLDSPFQDKLNEVMLLMNPFIGKLTLLSCYREEEPTSDLIQEKVAKAFEEWKKGYTPFMRAFGEFAETESIEDKPLSEQLGAFRGYCELTLGGLNATPVGDSMEMQINQRYGEGTGDRIREMLDAFIASKVKSQQ